MINLLFVLLATVILLLLAVSTKLLHELSIVYQQDGRLYFMYRINGAILVIYFIMLLSLML